jgi:hypothetical protein
MMKALWVNRLYQRISKLIPSEFLNFQEFICVKLWRAVRSQLLYLVMVILTFGAVGGSVNLITYFIIELDKALLIVVLKYII